MSCLRGGLHGASWLRDKKPHCGESGCDVRCALCRFLRARDFDLKAAAKMYSEYCTMVGPCAHCADALPIACAPGHARWQATGWQCAVLQRMCVRLLLPADSLKGCRAE